MMPLRMMPPDMVFPGMTSPGMVPPRTTPAGLVRASGAELCDQAANDDEDEDWLRQNGAGHSQSAMAATAQMKSAVASAPPASTGAQPLSSRTDGVGGSAGVEALSLPHMRMDPSFLSSTAQAHEHPFSGLGDLFDNSGESEATEASIDVWRADTLVADTLPRAQLPIVSLTDNGCGMDERSLRRLLSIGYTEKDLSTGKHYGMGTKTAIARLCSHALIFSRMGPVLTVGFLSATLFKELDADEMMVPQCSWDVGFSILQGSSEMAPLTLQERLDSLKIMLAHTPFKREEQLLQQFSYLHATGTRIVMWGIRTEVCVPLTVWRKQLDFNGAHPCPGSRRLSRQLRHFVPACS